MKFKSFWHYCLTTPCSLGLSSSQNKHWHQQIFCLSIHRHLKLLFCKVRHVNQLRQLNSFPNWIPPVVFQVKWKRWRKLLWSRITSWWTRTSRATSCLSILFRFTTLNSIPASKSGTTATIRLFFYSRCTFKVKLLKPCKRLQIFKFYDWLCRLALTV